MAKTFHIVQRMAPGGIESIVLDLVRADPNSAVISLEGSRDALLAAWPNLSPLADRLIALSKPDGTQPGLWWHLRRLMIAHGTQAIVTHHIGPLVYGGIAAALAGVERRVHVEHDGWHLAAPRRRLLTRIVDRLVRPRRVAVSHGTAMAVAQALGTTHQTIIPNGVDLDRYMPADQGIARARHDLPPHVPLIGCVGRLETVKGQDVLIEALALMPPAWHLALAGAGSTEAALRAVVERLGLGGRVHFLGQVSQPELLYPAFDRFCLPSRQEGFPRSLIEAQACGIPVIATDVGGVNEAVCPQTGRIVPAENPAALADALLEEISSRSPRAFVDPRFSNATMMMRYHALVSA